MGMYLYRLLGACALDRGVYEGIEADRRAVVTFEAFATVVLASLAAGIGSIGIYGRHFAAFGTVTGLALVMWFSWAVLVLQIGTRALPEADTHTDLGELLRTIGFASAPGLLQAFGVLPGVTRPLFFLTGIWMLVAMVVAVRQALDFHTTKRAIAVCGLAVLLSALTTVAVAVLFVRGVF
jgi:Yip1 domain